MKPLQKPMTRPGYEQLAREQHQLLKVERPNLLQAIATAAAEGDRSENAEYIYGRKKLREMDKRLRYLTSLFKDVQLIDPTRPVQDRINFANRVAVENLEGEQKTYCIVGLGETEFYHYGVSWRAPLGGALLGKAVDDEVVVVLPKGDVTMVVLHFEAIDLTRDLLQN